MKYKVLIVDDEEPARNLMRSYAEKLDFLEITAVVDNALTAKEIINTNEVDILLSDIQMDELTGLDLVKILKNPPVTIFTTAYSEYALEGYELDVIDYLVKPISFQRFCRAIDKARELIQYRDQSHNMVEATATTHESRHQSEFFFVKTNRKIVKVRYEDLYFVESFGEYVKLHTHDDVLLALKTTNFMEEMLPADNFIRIHRSHIVNIDHIDEVEGNQVVISGQKLTVSKRQREGFFKMLSGKGII